MESTRTAFTNALGALADAHRAVVIDTDTGTVKRRPRKSLYFNIGISETAAVGMASGLALTGTPVVVVGFSAFLAGRAYEFIKLDIALPNRPVVLVGTHAGMSAGWLGPTHHALEDITLMASLPNLTVYVPAEASRVTELLDAALRSNRPHYIRLGRKGSPRFDPPEGWSSQGWTRVSSYNEPTESSGVIVACGPEAIQAALDALELLSSSVPTPVVMAVEDLSALPAMASTIAHARYVLVAEEGWEPGYISSVLRRENPRQYILSIGCTETALPASSHETLLEMTGLTAVNIAEQVRAIHHPTSAHVRVTERK